MASVTKARGAPPGPNGASPAIILPDFLPPRLLEAEQVVLGCCLISTPAVARARDMLQPADFYLEAHRKVFSTILSIVKAGDPVSALTVPDALAVAGELDACGGISYLNECIDLVDTAAHIEYHARRVLQAAGLRHLVEECEAVRWRATEGEDLDALCGRLDTRIKTVEKRHRGNGPEVVTAAELKRRPRLPLEWLIPGLLPFPGVAVLAGKPKAKKSFWLLDAGLAVATGGMALGKLKVEPRGVLCCFTEDSFEEVQDRMGRAQVWPENFHITQDCERLDEGGEGWLHRWLEGHPDVKFVGLDPLVNVRGSGRNSQGNVYSADYSDMAAFRRVARRNGVGVLTLHHVRKLTSDDPFECISGSNGILGAVDAALVLETDATVENGTLHAKGRRVRPLSWKLSWDDRVGWVQEGNAPRPLESTGTQETRDTIALIRDHEGPIRFREAVRLLIADFGCKESTAKMRIRRAADAGLLATEAGMYWVTGKGHELVQREDSEPPVTGCDRVTETPVQARNEPIQGSLGDVTGCDRDCDRPPGQSQGAVTGVTGEQNGVFVPEDTQTGHTVTAVTPTPASVMDLARRAYFPPYVDAPSRQEVEETFQGWQGFTEGASAGSLSAAAAYLFPLVEAAQEAQP